MSVYLPSRKYVAKKSQTADPFEYETVLPQLSEIISTYQTSHEIILCGDMNASLQQRQGNKQDQSLAIFLQATDLKSHQSGKPTFFHGNGKDVSEIDYIFTKGAHSILQLPISVEDKPPHNLSDHTMLTGKLSITYRLRQKNLLTIPVKPNWHKCNQYLFQESVRIQIQQSFLSQHTSSAYDIHCQIRDLTDILKTATEVSIPGFSTKMVKKMSQKPRKWNPQITTAIRNSRKVWGDWKNAGRPSKDENAILHDKMRDAKTNLRKLTRQANAKGQGGKAPKYHG